MPSIPQFPTGAVLDSSGREELNFTIHRAREAHADGARGESAAAFKLVKPSAPSGNGFRATSNLHPGGGIAGDSLASASSGFDWQQQPGEFEDEGMSVITLPTLAGQAHRNVGRKYVGYNGNNSPTHQPHAQSARAATAGGVVSVVPDGGGGGGGSLRGGGSVASRFGGSFAGDASTTASMRDTVATRQHIMLEAKARAAGIEAKARSNRVTSRRRDHLNETTVGFLFTVDARSTPRSSR